MADFYHPPTEQKARKGCKCIYCGQQILAGDLYKKQSGVFEGDWFTNRYHPECWDDLELSGDDEFCPYSNERPLAAPAPRPESPTGQINKPATAGQGMEGGDHV